MNEHDIDTAYDLTCRRCGAEMVLVKRVPTKEYHLEGTLYMPAMKIHASIAHIYACPVCSKKAMT